MRQNILAISEFPADVNKLKQKCTYFEYISGIENCDFIYLRHIAQINMYISVYRK